MAERKFKKIIENLNHVNFDKTPQFTGIYHERVTLGQDSERPFDVFKFMDIETGELVYVPSNYSIEKGIKSLEEKGTDFPNTVINIVFLGKTEVNGKPFSRFDVGIMSLSEYNGNPEQEAKPKRTKK